VKTYPAGTRWTVKLTSGAFPSKAYPDTDYGKPGEPRYEDVCRYSALACLNHWRARSARPDEIRLVVIHPRADHEAEAERLRAAMVYVRFAIKNQREHNAAKGTARTLDEHLLVIDGLLGDALSPPDPARKEKTT
jgi:hypothetical protein